MATSSGSVTASAFRIVRDYGVPERPETFNPLSNEQGLQRSSYVLSSPRFRIDLRGLGACG